jgi:hypothetical protein
MGINQKALLAIKGAIFALIAFAVYPVVEKVLLTEVLIINGENANATIISSYYPASELIATIVAGVFLFRGRLIRIPTTKKLPIKNLVGNIAWQGLLTALGNICLIISQRQINPVVIVTLSLLPMLIAVLTDLMSGEETIKIIIQLAAAVLPIVATIVEAYPFSVDSVPIVLLIIRAGIVIKVEYLEKEIAGLYDENIIYAGRQAITFLVALIVAIGVTLAFNTTEKAYQLAVLCFSDGRILVLIVIIMTLCTLAGTWKIAAKGITSVSGVLILLNTPVIISIFATYAIYWAFLGKVAFVNPWLSAVSTLSITFLAATMLLEIRKKQK